MTTDHHHTDVILCPDGPMLLRGDHLVADDDGVEHRTHRPVSAVCRCGKSSIKPWCDATHKMFPYDENESRSMPGQKNRRLKKPRTYEKLRATGASKEKAARISNAAADTSAKSVSSKGGRSGSYEDWTVTKLKKRAKELDLSGYSSKRKSELISMLRNH